LEFEDVWLEVRACDGSGTVPAAEIEIGEAVAVPALSEVLQAAEKANASAAKHAAAGMWDYSRKLAPGEEEMVKRVVRFAPAGEDSRSVSLSASIGYRGSCYILTLFAIKKTQ
jgi:hypothetical protein